MSDGNVSEAELGDAFGDDGMGCFGSVGGSDAGAGGMGGVGNGAGASAMSVGTGFKGIVRRLRVILFLEWARMVVTSLLA